MKSTGSGVLKKSDFYFPSPSPTARRLFYCPVIAGHFYCRKGYHFACESENSFLVQHMISGNFTFVYDGEAHTAHEGETIFLNCCRPHEYYTNDMFESVWVQFNGLNSLEMYEEIVKKEGNIITCSNPQRMEDLLFHIFDALHSENRPSEFSLSMDIYSVLGELFHPLHVSRKTKASYEESIQAAKRFIHENLKTNLTVQQIADFIHMSPSHFSVVFKQQTGFSPYDYVLLARLTHAKNYLQKTDLPIAQIAEETGFNSESNFIYFFTKNAGVSPSKFRKLRY